MVYYLINSHDADVLLLFIYFIMNVGQIFVGLFVQEIFTSVWSCVFFYMKTISQENKYGQTHFPYNCLSLAMWDHYNSAV